MKNVIWWILLVVVVAACILGVFAWKFGHEISTHPPSSVQIAAYKFNLEMFKAILAGFVVAMLGLLIPLGITEARNNFERLKESRIAYSKAKTGLDYLALSLSTANLPEAHELVRMAHYDKHQAVLYPEFKQHIKDRYDNLIRWEDWDKVAYSKLRNTRILLKKNAAKWDQMTPSERLHILRGVLPDIDEVTAKSCDLLKYSLHLQDAEDRTDEIPGP
jgi:hypothetical protein